MGFIGKELKVFGAETECLMMCFTITESLIRIRACNRPREPEAGGSDEEEPREGAPRSERDSCSAEENGRDCLALHKGRRVRVCCLIPGHRDAGMFGTVGVK